MKKHEKLAEMVLPYLLDGLSMREAAIALGVKPRSVHYLKERGYLPAELFGEEEKFPPPMPDQLEILISMLENSYTYDAIAHRLNVTTAQIWAWHRKYTSVGIREIPDDGLKHYYCISDYREKTGWCLGCKFWGICDERKKYWRQYGH